MQYLANKEYKDSNYNNDNVVIKEKKSILQKELNTKEILIGLGITGVVLAYGFLSVYPKYTQLQSAKSELEGIQSEVSLYEAKMSSMPQLEDKLNSLNRELDIKSKILSHNMEDGMFLIGLSKLMDDVYVDLVDYSMEDKIMYESFYAIPTTLTVRGDYRNVREIMYYLEEQKNMTQILDYSMKTHIEETTETSTSDVTTKLVPDSNVYWTESGAAYHKESCSILETEKSANDGNVKEGESSISGKNTACQVCKPYTEETVSESTTSTESFKAKGQVEATFKFMMYSSDNPTLELENDDSSTWKPGKYNPFTSTI